MQDTWVRSLVGEDPLEEEMVTHSRILAWGIPWTEESGGLQSIESQRVGHDWSEWAQTDESQIHPHRCNTQASIPKCFVVVGSPGASVVKNLPVSAGDMGSISGEENATHSSFLAREISWTAEHCWTTAYGVTKSQWQLSDYTQHRVSLHKDSSCLDTQTSTHKVIWSWYQIWPGPQ